MGCIDSRAPAEIVFDAGIGEIFNTRVAGNFANTVEAVTKNNVLLTIEKIRDQSPILKAMEQNGEIKIVGCIYDIGTGKVEFL